MGVGWLLDRNLMVGSLHLGRSRGGGAGVRLARPVADAVLALVTQADVAGVSPLLAPGVLGNDVDLPFSVPIPTATRPWLRVVAAHLVSEKIPDL